MSCSMNAIWMGVKARARQRGVELPLVISDHADWTELTDTFREVAAEAFWITHGREEGLIRWAELNGMKARALRLVGYDDEDEEEGADEEGGQDAVVLMTIHMAKGLEFPVIFLAGMEDGLFPSLREREGTSEAETLEEERRLAYVAITRARNKLIISSARTRRQWGEVRLQSPSRFLEDIPRACLAIPTTPAPRTPPTTTPAAARRRARL